MIPVKCIYIPVASLSVLRAVVLQLLQLFVGVLCLVLVLLFSTLCPSSFAITLMGKRELAALL